MKIDIKQLTLT